MGDIADAAATDPCKARELLRERLTVELAGAGPAHEVVRIAKELLTLLDAAELDQAALMGALAAIRDRLAGEAERAEGGDLAPVTKLLVSVLGRLSAMSSSEVSARDDIATRRAARRAEAGLPDYTR